MSPVPKSHPNGGGCVKQLQTDQDQDGLLITFPSKIPSFSSHTDGGGPAGPALVSNQSGYLGLNDNLN